MKNAVRVEERSLSDYLKRAEVNSDKMLNVFVKENGKQELIIEPVKLIGWRDKPLHGQYSSRTDEKSVSC